MNLCDVSMLESQLLQQHLLLSLFPVATDIGNSSQLLICQNLSALTADKVNEKLVQLWTHLPDDEKVVYSKVAKNEILLMQGKDISSSSSHVKVEQNSEDPSKLFQQV